MHIKYISLILSYCKFETKKVILKKKRKCKCGIFFMFSFIILVIFEFLCMGAFCHLGKFLFLKQGKRLSFFICIT
jgi:hypothetical protein